MITTKYLVYDDAVITVMLMAKDELDAGKNLFRLAIRYLAPIDRHDKSGNAIRTTNIMSGETDWFILPISYSIAVAKHMIEQKVSGLSGFNEEGFTRLVMWLVDMEEIDDCMAF